MAIHKERAIGGLYRSPSSVCRLQMNHAAELRGSIGRRRRRVGRAPLSFALRRFAWCVVVDRQTNPQSSKFFGFGCRSPRVEFSDASVHFW